MASKKLKGITIEIDGNTTGLSDSLKDVNKNLYSVQSELKQVDNLLKFDPGNAELAAQKQALLSDAIEQTIEKLKTLRTAKEQADAKLASGDMSQKQYRELEREIIAAENSLKQLNGTSQTYNTTTNQLEKNVVDLSSAMSALDKVANTISGVFKTIAASAGALGASLVAAEASTREYRTDLSRLEENAKAANLDFDNMKNNLSDLTALTDETDSSVEALSNLMQTGFDDAGINQVLESLSGAIIAFPDTLKIESLADGLQETLATGAATGQFSELLERCGMDIEEFDAGLAEMSTTAERQQYILDTLSKTGMSELSKSYKETNKNLLTLKEAQFEFNDAMADIGEIIEPVEAEIMSFGADILKNLTSSFKEGGVEAFTEEFTNVINQVILKINEYLPQVLNLGIQIIQSIITGISTSLPQIVNCIIQVITQVIQTILSMLPQILQLGVDMIIQLINGIAQQAPELVPQILDCLILMVETLLDNIDLIVDAGISLILGLAEGLIDALPKLIEKIPEIIEGIISAITTNLPKLMAMGVELMIELGAGLIKAIPQLISNIPEIISAILGGLSDGLASVFDVGVNLVKGLWEGIASVGDWIWDKISGFFDGIVDGICDFFGINSPSKLMEEEVGKFIPQGIGVGIVDEIPKVVSDINNAMSSLNSGIESSVNPIINPTANTNPLIINIENFNNQRETDIQALAEELEFYRRQVSNAKGES